MAELGAAVPPRTAVEDAAEVRTHVPVRSTRQRVPGGRALVGGFLVAAAAVALFAVYADMTAVPSTAYVVAAADLPAGHRLTGEELRRVALDLPADLRGHAFADPAALRGAQLVVARGAGELLQRGDVVRRDGPPGARELTFAVDASRALGGRLRAGEHVDVVATYGSGDGATTVTVVRDAVVVRSTALGGALVGEGRVELTVSLHHPGDVLALVHAVNAGQVSVVRATGAAGELPARYRPVEAQ